MGKAVRLEPGLSQSVPTGHAVHDKLPLTVQLANMPAWQMQSVTDVALRKPDVSEPSGQGVQSLWSAAPRLSLYMPTPHSIRRPDEHQ